ncbi:MAG: glutaminyl-peptide cyclotransferase [Acidimicrobiia bacterium]|nr:glutaminyl-peptide cyclotransferase [Acidimicrobiia bacterium]
MTRLLGVIIAAIVMAGACGTSPSTSDADLLAPPDPADPTPTESDDGAPGEDPLETTPAAPDPTPGGGADPAPDAEAATAVERLTAEVVGEVPHDPGAFTQGLVVAGDTVYESTGRDSSLRRVDAATGEIELVVPIAEEYFAEGLELVDDRLIQLTWRSNVAFVYDVDTFERTGEFSYEGEGWGLCLDGDRLVMSDGTSTLTFRDPETFEPVGQVEVTIDGSPVDRLNELECVDGDVWANVWKTDAIVRIDPGSGAITAVVDASALAQPFAADEGAVLNGIAHNSERDTFLVTGKLWSTMYEVRFVPS